VTEDTTYRRVGVYLAGESVWVSDEYDMYAGTDEDIVDSVMRIFAYRLSDLLDPRVRSC
jgi:hypothetical protein